MGLKLLLPGIRRIKKKPIHSLMFALGIAFGSFLFTMTTMINQTADYSLKAGVEAIAGDTDLVITQNDSGFPDDILEKIRDMEGVKSAVPLVISRAIYKNLNGKSESLMVFGVDLFIESSVRNYGEKSKKIISDPLTFMSQADSLALTIPFAIKNKLELESNIDLMTTKGIKKFVIRTLIAEDDKIKTFGAGFAIMDIEAARLAFGKIGKLDRIDIQALPNTNLNQLISKIKNLLGPSYEINIPTEQVDIFKKSVTTFQKMSLFFCGLAFFGSFILVFLSVTHSVIQRRTEVGIMRTLGATKGQIFSLLFLETSFLAIIGSLTGVFFCYLISHSITETAQNSISTQTGIPIILIGLKWSFSKIFLFVFTGFFVATMASLLPLFHTAQLPILETIRQSNSTNFVLKKLNYPLIFGLFTLVLSLIFQLFSIGKNYQTFIIFLSAVLIGPWLVLKFLNIIEKILFKIKSPALKLALSHASRSHRNTQLIVFSLIFGMTILSIVSVVSSSFLSAVDDRMSKVASPDIFVSSNGSLITNQLQPLDYQLKNEISKIPGAEWTFGQRISRIRYRGQTINLRAIDEIPPINFKTPYSYLNVTDRPVEVAGHELYNGPGLPIMINQIFANTYNLKTNDHLKIETSKGPVEAKIVGIVSDLLGGGGSFFLSLDKYREYFNYPLVSGFGVFVKPGVDVEKVRLDISEHFSNRGLVAATRGDVRNLGYATIQKGFGYLKVIEWVLAGVSLLGFLNTFLIIVLSRFRTTATIRTLGMTSFNLLFSTLIEGTLIGLVGIFISIFLGWIVAYYFLTFSLGPQYGWIIQLKTNWIYLGLNGIAMTLIVSILSVYPAWRVSKQEIKNALSES